MQFHTEGNSLPSVYGIGDLGTVAYDFVDFLCDAKQAYWQILTLGPTGYCDSSYQCFSAFASNTNLISPELLVNDGLLDPICLKYLNLDGKEIHWNFIHAI
jgi:4-alpha-glucanotransferase